METPTEKVLYMKNENKPDGEIQDSLQKEGYDQQQILEAMNQAEIKSGVSPSTGMQESTLSQQTTEDDIPIPTPDSPQTTEQPRTQETKRIQLAQPAQVQLPSIEQTPIAQEQQVQQIVESVVEEKWHQFMANFGDLTVWKNRTEDDISAVKQEILRMQQRMDNLQKGIIGKVEEYNQNISKVSTEVQAMEKVFEKILQPLTENIKELSRIKDEMKLKK